VHPANRHGAVATQLGERLGVTFQQVQKYEAGANRMSMGRLRKAAAVFRIPMIALFEGANSKPQSSQGGEPSQALLADSRAYRLAVAFQAIDPIKHKNFRIGLVEMVERIAAVPQKRKRRRRRGKS
jgi:transcriptional regulator with XRE-family HTH domain